jgi:hypothetical protein
MPHAPYNHTTPWVRMYPMMRPLACAKWEGHQLALTLNILHAQGIKVNGAVGVPSARSI